MKTFIFAMGLAVSVAAIADAPVADAPAVEKGKFVRAHKPDDQSLLTWSPMLAKSVICTYKGPSGQTWDETMKPPCHSYSTHEVKPAAPATASQ